MKLALFGMFAVAISAVSCVSKNEPEAASIYGADLSLAGITLPAGACELVMGGVFSDLRHLSCKFGDYRYDSSPFGKDARGPGALWIPRKAQKFSVKSGGYVERIEVNKSYSKDEILASLRVWAEDVKSGQIAHAISKANNEVRQKLVESSWSK